MPLSFRLEVQRQATFPYPEKGLYATSPKRRSQQPGEHGAEVSRRSLSSTQRATLRSWCGRSTSGFSFQRRDRTTRPTVGGRCAQLRLLRATGRDAAVRSSSRQIPSHPCARRLEGRATAPTRHHPPSDHGSTVLVSVVESARWATNHELVLREVEPTPPFAARTERRQRRRADRQFRAPQSEISEGTARRTLANVTTR